MVQALSQVLGGGAPGTLSADRGAGDGIGCSDGASSEPGLGFRERVLGAAGGPLPG